MYMGIPIRLVREDGNIVRIDSNYPLEDETVEMIYHYLWNEGFGDCYIDKSDY